MRTIYSSPVTWVLRKKTCKIVPVDMRWQLVREQQRQSRGRKVVRGHGRREDDCRVAPIEHQPYMMPPTMATGRTKLGATRGRTKNGGFSPIRGGRSTWFIYRSFWMVQECLRKELINEMDQPYANALTSRPIASSVVVCLSIG